MELDAIDYRILAILQENSRVALSSLARKARISVPTARQRIKKLEEEGVIRRFTVLLDPDHVSGYDGFIGISASPAHIPLIAERLKEMDEVVGVYRTLGEYDLLVRLSLASHTELDRFIAEKLSKMQGIQAIKTNIVVGVLKDEPSPRLTPGRGIRVYCTTCGKEIREKPIRRTVDEKEYYFCCTTCVNLFDERLAFGHRP